MAIITKPFDVDISQAQHTYRLIVQQYDNNTRFFNIKLTNNGEGYTINANITSHCIAKVYCLQGNSALFRNALKPT